MKKRPNRAGSGVFCTGAEAPHAFPFGEGGFFIAPRTMKKTEEVLPQYGFAAMYQ